MGTVDENTSLDGMRRESNKSGYMDTRYRGKDNESETQCFRRVVTPYTPPFYLILDPFKWFLIIVDSFFFFATSQKNPPLNVHDNFSISCFRLILL